MYRQASTRALLPREAFRMLIRISGVGPRTALSVLSGMSVADIAQAVTAQDASRLIKIPGIGKKTAERLLLELKGGEKIEKLPRFSDIAEVHQALWSRSVVDVG